MSDCWDDNHFQLVDGELRPQPWMQWRNVGSIAADTKAAKYAVSGGGNKNVLIHSLTLGWTNDSPITQNVYGMVTRGSGRVTLQARSRGYLRTASAVALGSDPGDLTPFSYLGIGADTGVGGVLAIGSQFTVIENRANSTTTPLAPEMTGWLQVGAGQSIAAAVEVRFISEFWESSSIDGGDAGAESGFESGGTQLDLYALPLI